MSSYLEKEIADELDEIILRFEQFLNECGVELTSKSLNSVLRDLERVVAIRIGKEYLGISLNSNGYVDNINHIDTIISEQELPADITKGYYKVVDGKLVIDELMKEKLLGV